MTDQANNIKFARETGCPFANARHTMTAGPTGPVLMQDTDFLEKLAHFTREKTPARNVHALGCGAYGTFTVTNDITKYTNAKLFSKVGKKTDIVIRMSGIFTEQGDPDTSRDPRGFAIKFYTEDGNWDLLGINTPVFSVRDLKPGPDNVHAFKRDPRTGLWNATQFWDYVANHPEGLHQVLMLYTDRIGTPMSYRKMNAYGCHTFSFVNDENKVFWVKFHLISEQGAAGLTAVQAKLLAGEDPNFLSRDLKTAIEKGQFPRWKLACQIMPEEEGYQRKWSFDPTKVWKHKDYPLIDIGLIELNRNPINYFSEVEQVAFSPSTIVPGIGFSPDKLLQGRLLIYDDTQRHRIGANYKQLPVNRPNGKPSNKTQYYGAPMNYEVENKYPHFWPSTTGNNEPQLGYVHPAMKCDGPAGFYPPKDEYSDADIFEQCRDFISILEERDLQHLIENLAIGLEKVDSKEVLEKQLQTFSTLDKQFGTSVRALLEARRMGAIKKTEGETLLQQLNLELLGTTVPERK